MRAVQVVVVSSLLLALAGPAAAQELAAQGEVGVVVPGGGGRQPLAFAQRPMTLPAMTLRIDPSLSIFRVPDVVIVDATGMMVVVESDPIVEIRAGGGFGILDDFEAGALVLPLLLSPQVEYGNPRLYAMYRFVRGEVEVAGRLDLSLPVRRDAAFVVSLGVPVLIRASETVRFDTGGFLILEAADRDTVTTLHFPFALNVNVTEALTFGVTTGFVLPDVDFDFFSIPLGVQGAYAIAGTEGPAADLFVRFLFPAFLVPGSDGDAVITEVYEIQLGANVFVYN